MGNVPVIHVGTVIPGYAGGYFGRDSYESKRVEALGADWIVAREVDPGRVVFAGMSPESLAQWLDYDPDA